MSGQRKTSRAGRRQGAGRQGEAASGDGREAAFQALRALCVAATAAEVDLGEWAGEAQIAERRLVSLASHAGVGGGAPVDDEAPVPPSPEELRRLERALGTLTRRLVEVPTLVQALQRLLGDRA